MTTGAAKASSNPTRAAASVPHEAPVSKAAAAPATATSTTAVAAR